MGKYRELVTKAMDKGFGPEAWELTDDLIDMLKTKHSSVYEDFIGKLEHLAYRIPHDDAERIVRSMRPKGQYWSYQQIKDYLASKNIKDNCVNWYLVMNMVYNDYYDTAKIYGLQGDPEFFFNLAKDFIEDIDAKPMKIEKYFLD